MKIRKIVIGAAVVIVGVPVVLILIVVVSVAVLDGPNGTIVSSGKPGSYLLYVPRSYDRAKPTPLVISMHGAAGWPAQQMNLSRWNRLAESQGFVVVYASGSDVPNIWHVDRGAGLMRDVGFISALIDTLEAAYNIDPTRMIAFHGTADPIVPYQGGPLGDPFNPVTVTFPAVRDWVASWARRNRCAANPVDSVVAADVTRREYTHCADHAAVVRYTIQGGGHSWPGGKPLPQWWVGPTSRSIDATSEMWAVLRAHQRLRNWQGQAAPVRRLRAG